MKIIQPLSGKFQASCLARLDYFWVIKIAFCYCIKYSSQLLLQLPDFFVHPLKNVNGAHIIDPVNSIKAKAVDMKVFKPIHRIVRKEISDSIAPGSVKIYGFSPWSFIVIRKIRPKFFQVISFGSQMIINNIQKNRNALLMAGTH